MLEEAADAEIPYNERTAKSVLKKLQELCPEHPALLSINELLITVFTREENLTSKDLFQKINDAMIATKAAMQLVPFNTKAANAETDASISFYAVDLVHCLRAEASDNVARLQNTLHIPYPEMGQQSAERNVKESLGSLKLLHPESPTLQEGTDILKDIIERKPSPPSTLLLKIQQALHFTHMLFRQLPLEVPVADDKTANTAFHVARVVSFVQDTMLDNLETLRQQTLFTEKTKRRGRTATSSGTDVNER